MDGASQNRLTAAKYAKIQKEVNKDYANYLGVMIATGVDYGYQNMFGTNADGSMMNSLKGEDFLLGSISMVTLAYMILIYQVPLTIACG